MNNDILIANYFKHKNTNYKKNINFNIWVKHYEPFLNELFYDFVEICEKNELHLIFNDNLKNNFYLMLYNTSSGILVDKKDFPYAYGLIKENFDDINNNNYDDKNNY